MIVSEQMSNFASQMYLFSFSVILRTSVPATEHSK